MSDVILGDQTYTSEMRTLRFQNWSRRTNQFKECTDQTKYLTLVERNSTDASFFQSSLNYIEQQGHIVRMIDSNCWSFEIVLTRRSVIRLIFPWLSTQCQYLKKKKFLSMLLHWSGVLRLRLRQCEKNFVSSWRREDGGEKKENERVWDERLFQGFVRLLEIRWLK